MNPQVEGTLDAITFELGGEHGFRAPSNIDRAYTDIEPGRTLKWFFDDGEFVHTKTGEKFSTDRYEVRKAYVNAVIDYKGTAFPRTSFFQWRD